MKTLKLEVGKTYRSRNGKRVEIVENDGKDRHPFRGDNDEWYAESGRYGYSTEDPEDLIEEVAELPETRHTFKIPEGVKKVTVEHVGNRIVVEVVPEEVEPKPGDVMVNTYGSVYIFKEAKYNGESHNYFAWLGSNGRLAYNNIALPGRPATAEEAQPLWDALEKAGKKWNAETMEVEDVLERERIMDFLQRYANNVTWNYEQLCWMIEAYLDYREGEK